MNRGKLEKGDKVFFNTYKGVLNKYWEDTLFTCKSDAFFQGEGTFVTLEEIEGVYDCKLLGYKAYADDDDPLSQRCISFSKDFRIKCLHCRNDEDVQITIINKTKEDDGRLCIKLQVFCPKCRWTTNEEILLAKF